MDHSVFYYKEKREEKGQATQQKYKKDRERGWACGSDNANFSIEHEGKKELNKYYYTLYMGRFSSVGKVFGWKPLVPGSLPALANSAYE